MFIYFFQEGGFNFFLFKLYVFIIQIFFGIDIIFEYMVFLDINIFKQDVYVVIEFIEFGFFFFKCCYMILVNFLILGEKWYILDKKVIM